MEYEFTTVFDLAMDHNAVASKDRTWLFDGQVFKPTIETGEEDHDVAQGRKGPQKPAADKGSRVPEPGGGPTDYPDESNSAMATDEQKARISAGIKTLRDLGRAEQFIWKGISGHIRKAHGREVIETNGLTEAEAGTVIEYLSSWAEHIRAEAGNGSPAGRA